MSVARVVDDDDAAGALVHTDARDAPADAHNVEGHAAARVERPEENTATIGCLTRHIQAMAPGVDGERLGREGRAHRDGA